MFRFFQALERMKRADDQQLNTSTNDDVDSISRDVITAQQQTGRGAEGGVGEEEQSSSAADNGSPESLPDVGVRILTHMCFPLHSCIS